MLWRCTLRIPVPYNLTGSPFGAGSTIPSSRQLYSGSDLAATRLERPLLPLDCSPGSASLSAYIARKRRASGMLLTAPKEVGNSFGHKPTTSFCTGCCHMRFLTTRPSRSTSNATTKVALGAYTISLAPFALRVTSRNRYSPFDGPA